MEKKYELALKALCPECYEGFIVVRKGSGGNVVLSCPFCHKYEEIFNVEELL